MSVKTNAQLDYELGMKYKELSEKYDVSTNTLKSWKARDKWIRKEKVTKKNATATKSATKKKKVATENQEKLQKVAVEKSVDELSKSDLNEKQKRFCLLYLKNFNATQSYIDVYDVSYDVAKMAGPRLIANDRVKKLLNKLKEEISQDLFLTVQDIASNYAKIAFSDYGQFIKWNSYEEDVLDDAGSPVVDNDGNTLKRHYVDIDIADMDKVDTSLIKSVSKGKDGLKLELYDKMKANDKLMKYFSNDKFNVDDKEVSPLENLLDEMNDGKIE